MKLIMPMAGDGSRFAEAGYQKPKPLIDVNGLPMFVHSVNCIGIEFEEKIFITKKEHNLDELIWDWFPEAHVIQVEERTEGTACTLMLAEEHWYDGSSIFVSNCDQHVEWNGDTSWMEFDGAIATFDCPDKHPKWSYAQTDENGWVTRVAEKDPISELATVGWYYWKDGRQFEKSVLEMIEADDRVNGEFYTCPTYNYLLKQGCGVRTFEVNSMQGIGTPEDLELWRSQQK